MQRLRNLVAVSTLTVAALPGCGMLASRSREAPPPAIAQTIARKDLCVTSGEVESAASGHLAVATPAMRAVVARPTLQAAELRFVYEGPSDAAERLASGEVRRQIGLKLRAQDSCNVVYAMWRIEPEPTLVVSVKRNAGKRRHSECGDRGYRRIEPDRSKPMPEVAAAEPHALSAELDEDDLVVRADGKVVWEGSLGESALEFDGPVGVRTDNGRFEFELIAAPAPAGEAGEATDCAVEREAG